MSEIDSQYIGRSMYMRLLLHAPKTPAQRKALISYLADKEMSTSHEAYEIVSKLSLTDEEYIQIEHFLRFKAQYIRESCISLLKERPNDKLKETVRRLLSSEDEQMRLAGLDIVKTKAENDKANKAEWLGFIGEMGDTNEQEQVIIEGLTDEGVEAQKEKGFGLYNPSISFPYDYSLHLKEGVLSAISGKSKAELDKIFLDIIRILDNHGKDEYKDAWGETCIIANGIHSTSRDYKLPLHESYAFPELWKEIFDNCIKDEKTFWNVYFAEEARFYDTRAHFPAEYEFWLSKIFGAAARYQIPDERFRSSQRKVLHDNLQITFLCIESLYGFKIPHEIAAETAKVCASVPESLRKFKRVGYTNTITGQVFEEITNFLKDWRISKILLTLSAGKSEEDVKDALFLTDRLSKLYDLSSKNSEFKMTFYNLIKGCEYGVVSAELAYKYAFEVMDIAEVVSELSVFMKEKPTPREMIILKRYIGDDEYSDKLRFVQIGKEFYSKITDVVLDVELKRGDSETVFTNAARKMNAVYGADRLVAILKALGKETLDRTTYYYWTYSYRKTGKKESLSHLLAVCYPASGDSAETLRELVSKTGVSETRLIETALYSPQWLDIVEEYLGYNGFKSCCYYFMAHMNERFDDKKKAMIAKYTPLSAEELNNGCFDVDWFFEAYEAVGEKTFSQIYKAAKYISDGNKHSRARKYADAALGLVERDKLEEEINDKRNKDLLMSYGLIPIEDEKDELHRYEFIQKYLKESKQFGSQRRVSEAKAVESALKNLATRAGYADDMRLILAMETALVKENNEVFAPTKVGEYVLTIVVDKLGKPEIVYEKDGKKLKSAPAAIKKEELYLERKEFVTKLRNQYSRCVKMFENAMEQKEMYKAGELRKLCTNPVIAAIIMNLVFVCEKDGESICCLIGENGFVKADGSEVKTADDTLLRVAHPYDMYEMKCWPEFQRYYFNRQNESGAKQPFKQVFRELYLKLPEEIDMCESRMFAGNQIQPAKTVATLKTRQWVADYEDGLQKVYYKDNIIATIYALADWFSPADVECPTLEWVSFYNRKTFEHMKIADVPPIIYSEVMRDTDLAVSVAHAGGVDPMTSHSTVEMRSVIVAFNLELFKLSNVRLEGSHAFIKGAYAEYSVHLGSGVIHKIGGRMINVLPVHSQSRGKLFLPFIDEDPKSAEIMSKILLFAEDTKIKDPFIMEQIKD